MTPVVSSAAGRFISIPKAVQRPNHKKIADIIEIFDQVILTVFVFPD
jgi:hypothetical protein